MKSTSILAAALIAGLATSSVVLADHHTGHAKKADAKKKKHDKKGDKHACGGKDGCGAKEGAKEGATTEGQTAAPAEEAQH